MITTLGHNCESVGLKVGFQITTVGILDKKWVFSSLLLVCWTRIGSDIKELTTVGLLVLKWIVVQYRRGGLLDLEWVCRLLFWFLYLKWVCFVLKVGLFCRPNRGFVESGSVRRWVCAS